MPDLLGNPDPPLLGYMLPPTPPGSVAPYGQPLGASLANLARGAWGMTPMAAANDAINARADAIGQAQQGNWGGATAGGLASLLSAIGAVPGVSPEASAARRGIRAYHASPHDFDAFDLSKVGSGQGAQMYGHGIYAAESPAVSGGGGSYDREFTAKNLGKYDLNQQEASILNSIRSGKSDLDILREQAQMGSSFDEAQAALDRVKAAKAKIYEVSIAADPSQLLDWDKPLSEQSDAVQKALLSSNPNASRYIQENGLGGAPLGALYKSGVLGSTPENTSTALRGAGIPGIQYLDQGSRAAGEGTRNYVMFDPSLITIMRKYGLIPPVAGAVAAPQLLGGDNGG